MNGVKTRGAGRPSVWKNKDGSWCGEAYLGVDPKTGKKVRKKWKRRTRGELLDAIEKWQEGSEEDGREKLGPSMRVWLDTVKKPGLKNSSYQRLYSTVKLHVIPALGNMYIEEVKTSDIQKLVTKTELSQSSKKKIKDCLSDFYNYYIYTHDATMNNPALFVVVGKMPPKTEPDWYLSDYDCREFIKACREQKDPRADCLELILQTGLRIGEALALDDDSMEWNTNTLSITKTLATRRKIDAVNDKIGKVDRNTITSPKTRAGVRHIPLNDRAAEIIKTRSRAADYKDGERLFPYSITGMEKYVRKLYKKIGWEGRQGCHTLRHSYVVSMLRAGQIDKDITLAEISALVGHRSLSITVDVYGHVSELIRLTKKEGSKPRFNPSVKKK